MSRITVRIEVTVEGPLAGNGEHPTSLSWNYGFVGDDNPRFYSDSVRKAVRTARARASTAAIPTSDTDEEHRWYRKADQQHSIHDRGDASALRTDRPIRG